MLTKKVVACDMAHTSLEKGSVDIAVFCLVSYLLIFLFTDIIAQELTYVIYICMIGVMCDINYANFLQFNILNLF